MIRVFLFFWIFLAFNASAQKIRFTDTSNKWVYIGSYEKAAASYHHSIRQWYDGDTIIAGKKYQRLATYYPKANEKYTLLVREDTSSGKVFQIQGPMETIYMDYSWQQGDTVDHNSTGSPTTVFKIDTISIGGYQHKVFTLLTVPVFNVFIEGIGHTDQSTPVGMLNVACFSNQGTRPFIAHFRNSNQGDCSDSALTVKDNTAISNFVSVYPQPAHNSVTIHFPYNISYGLFVLTNNLGQTVFRKEIKNEQHLDFCPGLVKGVYIYHFTDNATNHIYSGKLIFAD